MSDNRQAYFRTEERTEALKVQLKEWAGTRWRHAGARPNEMRCGVAGDCLFWVHVFKAIGALPESILIPDYRRMEAAGDSMKTLIDKIEATHLAGPVTNGNIGEPPATRVALDTVFIVGDVLLFQNGMSGVHCGLVTRAHPTQFIHLGPNGCIVEPLNQDHFSKTLTRAYRLLEPLPEGTLL